jgi:hypothetical protein
MILAPFAVLASLALAAPAPAPSSAPVPARPGAPVLSTGTLTGVVKSTAATYVPASPSTIYTAEKVRDPFTLGGGGGGSISSHPFNLDEFSIHNLTLRGLMKDRAADFALFTDNSYGNSLILKHGRLYDPKGKPIPRVTGKLDVRRKTATLQTEDQDVQVFRLGEEGEE